jgi:hypothetical protein
MPPDHFNPLPFGTTRDEAYMMGWLEGWREARATQCPAEGCRRLLCHFVRQGDPGYPRFLRRLTAARMAFRAGIRVLIGRVDLE